MSKAKERAVIVTTSHRGVFFGYLNSDSSGSTMHLKRARNAVYWTADLRGFMGLAAIGPGKHCRVGPAADIELRDVTAVVECTPEATTKWEAAPWS